MFTCVYACEYCLYALVLEDLVLSSRMLQLQEES